MAVKLQRLGVSVVSNIPQSGFAPSAEANSQDGYTPFPDPKDLDRKVSQICGPYSRDTKQCFFENKLKMWFEF